MAAVLLACAAGVLYGAVAVTLRLGLARYTDAYVGALASIVVAFSVCTVAAAVAADAPGGLGDVWPYLVGGALAPGISQLLFVLAGELRRAVGPFLLSGLLFGVAYACLLEAFERGKVTVVAPLVGTESLWAVALAALVLGRSEMIDRRVAVAGVLVVVGGALIGSWR